jgi:hypothetical protein
LIACARRYGYRPAHTAKEESPVKHLALLLILSLFVVVAACGCAQHYAPTDPKLNAPTATFDVPPKQMVQKIKQVVTAPPLSLGVEQEDKGTILTTPQRFPGEFHVARRWQEQTRYRITVSPDFDEPTKRCTVQVREFTEQRAAEGMKWESSESLPRPQRAADLLEQIRKAVAGGATTQAATASG